ncbi:hypothetical protein TKK_0012887 [Trichogramma kaykai]|uniref:H15 domain-containing protein n=1 Tax=Trichogramma kaykai TaxID=54128 RepID=A0ABD2WM38_9HYME
MQQPPEKSQAKQVRSGKLIEQVMQAISALADKQGSSTKDILSYVTKNSKGTNRNLTLKVQQALKQGVRDGKIKLRSGRYKIIIISVKATADPVNSKSEATRGTTAAGGGSSSSQRKRAKRVTLKVPSTPSRPSGKDKAATNQTSTKSSNAGSKDPSGGSGVGKKNKHQ